MFRLNPKLMHYLTTPMNVVKRIEQDLGRRIVTMIFVLALAGCEFEVPITPSPTRKVDQRLLGDWASSDGKEKMKVRMLDDFIYVVSYNGDLFRAYHSDVAKASFVSVQDIDSRGRKYAYLNWKLSDDGKQLVLRAVKKAVVPKETKDSATVRDLLEKNAANPELLGEEGQFTKSE